MTSPRFGKFQVCDVKQTHEDIFVFSLLGAQLEDVSLYFGKRHDEVKAFFFPLLLLLWLIDADTSCMSWCSPQPRSQ